MKTNKINFNGQDIFIGIDVHKKSWSIAIVVHGYLTERFSIDPKPKILKRRLNELLFSTQNQGQKVKLLF